VQTLCDGQPVRPAGAKRGRVLCWPHRAWNQNPLSRCPRPLRWQIRTTSVARCFIHDGWSGVVATVALSRPGVLSGTGTDTEVTRAAVGAAATPAARPVTLERERRRGTGRAGTVESAARVLRVAVGARRTGRGGRLARLARRTRFAMMRFAITRFATARFTTTCFGGTRFAITRRTRRAARRRVSARRRPCPRRAGPVGRARDLRVDRSARDPAVSLLALLPETFFCSRRARFQALRAAAASLRARLASRLASLRRLRARLSSSLAMRTRCLATSACSRTRSSGSAGGSCSPPVFFIRWPAKRKDTQSHTRPGAFPPRILIHRNCA